MLCPTVDAGRDIRYANRGPRALRSVLGNSITTPVHRLTAEPHGLPTRKGILRGPANFKVSFDARIH